MKKAVSYQGKIVLLVKEADMSYKTIVMVLMITALLCSCGPYYSICGKKTSFPIDNPPEKISHIFTEGAHWHVYEVDGQQLRCPLLPECELGNDERCVVECSCESWDPSGHDVTNIDCDHPTSD